MAVRDDITQSLLAFDSISLAEMDSVKLMDRMDQKYVLPDSQLAGFLDAVRDQYRVLEVSGTRMSRYETLYYDTPGYDLYLEHHNGRTSRYKIRMRRYVESDLNFFEVKYKNNKGRTIKTRVRRDELNPVVDGNAEQLLTQHTTMTPSSLEPKLWVNYTRITLVNRFAEERLTIDLDLEIRNEESSRLFDGLVIIEAKQGKAVETPFIRLLKKNHVREGGMSKYCLAVGNLIHNIKKNNFKPDILSIEKICNTNASSD